MLNSEPPGIIEKFEYNIPHQIDEIVKERQMKYQKIVKTLYTIPYLIGKQRISYQGTQKTAANSDALRNPGIFLGIVRQVQHRYLLLYEHICSTLRKVFFYMSPTNQNELIGKINLSNDFKKVKSRSISVNKVTYVYVYIYV